MSNIEQSGDQARNARFDYIRRFNVVVGCRRLASGKAYAMVRRGGMEHLALEVSSSRWVASFTRHTTQPSQVYENEFRVSARLVGMVRDGVGASYGAFALHSPAAAFEEDVSEDVIRTFLVSKLYSIMSVLAQRARYLKMERYLMSGPQGFVPEIESLLRDRFPLRPRAIADFASTLHSELGASLVLRGAIRVGIGRLARVPEGIVLEVPRAAMPPARERRPERTPADVTFG